MAIPSQLNPMAEIFTLATGRLTEKAVRRTVVVFAEARTRLTEAAALIDAQVGGQLSRTLKGTRYQGNLHEMARITVQHETITQVLVVGLGKQAGLETRDWWKTGLSLGRQLDAMGVREATIALGQTSDTSADTDAAHGQLLLEGLGMALYRFERFKSELKDHQLSRLEKITVLTSTRAARLMEEAFPRTQAILSATRLTRDCANLPPNVANPQFMADEARKLEKMGLKIEIIDEVQMKKLGLNLFLAVGGSARTEDAPRLVLMHYQGGAKSEAPIALIGKGIMYDTGGYDLKPSASMGGMKYDMSGAAAVLGTMQALADVKAPVNVVGVLACAMNMVGANPFVNDSVYQSYKGLFVEIGNTDAEGRLVLADAMAYTIDKYQPSQIVDVATLTGACMVALGGGYAGLFSTSNTLAAALQRAGDEVGERLWRLPVDDFYAAKTSVADVNNNGSRWGGASTAAVFIKKFADKTPWAHLDIAGVANKDKGASGVPEAFSGATAFGVRLLLRWLESTAIAAPVGPAPRRGRPAARSSARAAGRGASRNARAAPRVPVAVSVEGATAPRRGRPRKAVAAVVAEDATAATTPRPRGRPRKTVPAAS